MANTLERRVEALEAQSSGDRPLAELSDDELEERILRLHLGREPTANELREWMTVPPLEAERRSRAMLADARRWLSNCTSQSDGRHALA